MNLATLFDIIYALAAKDSREARLFGDCSEAVREAFGRCLAAETLPELWFELPLAGKPWLDFHALTSYEDVANTHAGFAGHDGAYADALAWFAAQKPGKVRQLALSYDTSTGDVEHPAVQLLVNGSDTEVPLSFLEAAGRPDLRSFYREFVRAMPPEWYACYVGVFPRRSALDDDPWVRVECIVGDKYQQAYADDAATLRAHLSQVGLAGISESAIDGIRTLARSSFPLELQFNVGPGGMAASALSASVRFQPSDWTNAERKAEIGRLAWWLQKQGLADDRCELLANMAFANRVGYEDESVRVACYPAFVKLRWRDGMPPDAKAYLIALAS